MAQARDAVLARLAGTQDGGQTAARLAVRTSMRNQWPCAVRAIEGSGQIVRVHLDATGTHPLALTARITRESVELLGLAPGQSALALCKATAVQVEKAVAGAVLGANAWFGRATRVSHGDAGDEVSAELDVGMQMVGVAPAASGLRPRSRVVLRVDESAVVLAV
jgi:molybdate transport system regulatory protein